MSSAASDPISRISRRKLAFGAAALGNLYQAIDDAQAAAALEAAIAAGACYVDVAPHYGQGLAERRVGRTLKDHPQVALSTKVGRVLEPIAPPPPGAVRHGFVDGDPFEPRFDYSRDGVLRSFADSQKRLGRERIDLILVHDLGAATHGADAGRHSRIFLDSGLAALHELKSQGLIGAIGLGVNEWQVCQDLFAHADFDAVLLAGRYTLLEQTALKSFLPLCEQRGVAVIAAAPFNSGILSGGQHYNYGDVPEAIRERAAALQAVCDAHDVPLAAAALQFPAAHPAVACVLAGMASKEQAAANFRLSALPIPEAFWRDLRRLRLIDEAAPLPVEAVA